MRKGDSFDDSRRKKNEPSKKNQETETVENRKRQKSFQNVQIQKTKHVLRASPQRPDGLSFSIFYDCLLRFLGGAPRNASVASRAIAQTPRGFDRVRGFRAPWLGCALRANRARPRAPPEKCGKWTFLDPKIDLFWTKSGKMTPKPGKNGPGPPENGKNPGISRIWSNFPMKPLKMAIFGKTPALCPLKNAKNRLFQKTGPPGGSGPKNPQKMTKK